MKGNVKLMAWHTNMDHTNTHTHTHTHTDDRTLPNTDNHAIAHIQVHADNMAHAITESKALKYGMAHPIRQIRHRAHR